MFSDEIYQVAKSNNKHHKLDDLSKDLENHNQYYIEKTTLPKELQSCTDVKKLFGYNTIRFIQVLLYRSKSLIEGSIIALNHKRILTSILSVRAHYETTGSISFLLKRLLSYYEGNIQFERMDNDLFRLSLGATTIENPEAPKPINALDLIDSTDHMMKKHIYGGKPPGDKMFRELYEVLCDFCHPNYHGTSVGSDIVHEEKALIFHKTDYLADRYIDFFFYLNMSARLFLHFYSETLKLIKQKAPGWSGGPGSGHSN
jgi:hypothetical protein